MFWRNSYRLDGLVIFQLTKLGFRAWVWSLMCATGATCREAADLMGPALRFGQFRPRSAHFMAKFRTTVAPDFGRPRCPHHVTYSRRGPGRNVCIVRLNAWNGPNRAESDQLGPTFSHLRPTLADTWRNLSKFGPTSAKFGLWPNLGPCFPNSGQVSAP